MVPSFFNHLLHGQYFLSVQSSYISVQDFWAPAGAIRFESPSIRFKCFAIRFTTAATKLPRYSSDTAFKGAVDGLGNAGTALKTAVGLVVTNDAAAHVARTSRNSQRRAYDKAYGVAAKLVEQDAVSKADIEDAGFAFLDPSNPGLLLPSGITVKYDGKLSLIRVHVVYAAGRRPCVVEISVDPVTATSWQRLNGNGVKRALSGYAPGTYWIHAATVRAQVQSAWFGPVSVVVK